MLQIKLIHKDRLSRSKGQPHGAAFQRHQVTFLDQLHLLREVGHNDAQFAALRIVERNTGRVVVHHLAHGAGNDLEQFMQIKMGNDGVIDLQHRAQAVRLQGRFLLGFARPLEVQRVIHRDGNLAGDLTEQFLLLFGESIFSEAGHAQHAEFAAMDNQRNAAARFDPQFNKSPVEICGMPP